MSAVERTAFRTSEDVSEAVPITEEQELSLLDQVEVELALREREEEWARASVEAVSSNCSEFINSYCQIDDAQNVFGEEGVFPFRLWPKQEEVLSLLLTYLKIVILKARQLGVSWLVCAYVLWVSLFKKNQLCLFFSRGQSDANELLRRVKVLYERLPSNIRGALPKPISWGVESLEFSNGSRVKSFPSSPSSGRTYTGSVVVVDECAFLQWDRELFNALKPTIDAHGQLIVLSTANGLDNLFALLWQKAVSLLKEGVSSYLPIFLSCLDRPDRDLSWYGRKREEALDVVLFDQEYPLSAEDAFVTTARNPFLPTPLWWEQCKRPAVKFRERDGMVLALDASISGASFGILGVSRHPEERQKIVTREVKEFRPDGRPLDHQVIKQYIKDVCKRLPVYQICYDPYQLHLMASQLEAELRVWVEPFQQQTKRLIADSSLLDAIRDQMVHHQGQPELADHILNADRKVDAEEHKLRIVQSQRGHVDLAVCLSMAHHRALELNL